MKKPTLSFEFFPPRSEAQTRRFWRTFGCLETLSPSFFSVTYGALGSGSQASVDTVTQLQKDSSFPVAAHLTCAGQTRAQLTTQLEEFRSMGVKHIVALRGDAIPSDDESKNKSKYYHLRFASELVELINEVGGFDVSVAAYPEVHPEALSAEKDMQVLKRKLDAGASRALTQFFFEPEVFLRWRDMAVKFGIDKPLIPGILPIHDINKVVDFSGRCGATVPPALIELFNRAQSNEAKHARAIDHCVDLCKTLQHEGVEEFHLYTLNQSELAFEVSKELLGVSHSNVAA